MFWVCKCSEFICVLRFCPNCSGFFFFYTDLYIFLDLWVWFPRGFNVDCVGIFCAKIDFEWVSQLDLSWFGEEQEEWSSGLEVSRFDIFLGWRFDDFSGLVFSCGFRFDDFFMFWRFRWRIGILSEILHYSGFDCALVLGLIVLGFEKNMKNKFLCSYLKNNESNNNNNIRFKSLFFLI